jgi:hypothetical protein
MKLKKLGRNCWKTVAKYIVLPIIWLSLIGGLSLVKVEAVQDVQALDTSAALSQSTALPNVEGSAGTSLPVAPKLETGPLVQVLRNAATAVPVANHIPQQPAYDGQDYSQEVVELTISCAKVAGQLQLNGVTISYAAGESTQYLPLRVPNSGELSITSSQSICASAQITQAFQNPQNKNTQNRPVVAPGGTLIVDPLQLNGQSNSSGLQTVSVLGQGDVSTPAQYAYQNVRAAYVALTGRSSNSTTHVNFYNPVVDERGIQQLPDNLADSQVAFALDLAVQSTVTALVPVDFYGQLNYIGDVDIELLGIIEDSLPIYSQLNARGAQPTKFGTLAPNSADFTLQTENFTSTDTTPTITFNVVNDGQPIDLSKQPYTNFSGTISYSDNRELESLLVYAEGEIMGAATLNLAQQQTESGITEHTWNFYAMLSDSNSSSSGTNITIVAHFSDEQEISASQSVKTIGPDSSATIIAPRVFTNSDDLDARLLDADDDHIYLSGTAVPTSTLYDGQGNILQVCSPIHVGDIIVLAQEQVDPSLNGLMRRVLAIYTVAGKTVLETENVSPMDTVVQSDVDRCEVAPPNGSTQVIPTAENGEFDSSQTDDLEYEQMRSEYVNYSGIPESETPLAQCSEAEVPDTSNALTVPLNINNFSIRNTPGVKLPIGVTVEGRGQIDIAAKGKLVFGLHLTIKVSVNWKNVAAAIAAGVGAFVVIETVTAGIGTGAAIIAAIAAAVAVCAETGCIVFEHFRISTVYGYEVAGGISAQGKLIVKATLFNIKVFSDRWLVMIGFIPIYIGIDIGFAVEVEVYASGQTGFTFLQGQYDEVGKEYLKESGWHDIRLHVDVNHDNTQRVADKINVGAAINIVPTVELSLELIFKVYFQIRFKLELMIVVPCEARPVTIDSCGTFDTSPYMGFRFGIYFRLGFKISFGTASKWEFTVLNVAFQQQIYRKDVPIACFFISDCAGMHPNQWPYPNIEDLWGTEVDSQLNRILDVANYSSAEFDDYLQHNSLLISTDELLSMMTLWTKIHNQLTGVELQVFARLTPEKFLKIFEDDYFVDYMWRQDFGNYLPYNYCANSNFLTQEQVSRILLTWLNAHQQSEQYRQVGQQLSERYFAPDQYAANEFSDPKDGEGELLSTRSISSVNALEKVRQADGDVQWFEKLNHYAWNSSTVDGATFALTSKLTADGRKLQQLLNSTTFLSTVFAPQSQSGKFCSSRPCQAEDAPSVGESLSNFVLADFFGVLFGQNQFPLSFPDKLHADIYNNLAMYLSDEDYAALVTDQYSTADNQIPDQVDCLADCLLALLQQAETNTYVYIDEDQGILMPEHAWVLALKDRGDCSADIFNDPDFDFSNFNPDDLNCFNLAGADLTTEEWNKLIELAYS